MVSKLDLLNQLRDKLNKAPSVAEHVELHRQMYALQSEIDLDNNDLYQRLRQNVDNTQKAVRETYDQYIAMVQRAEAVQRVVERAEAVQRVVERAQAAQQVIKVPAGTLAMLASSNPDERRQGECQVQRALQTNRSTVQAAAAGPM
jgi:hypothetical protein